MFHTSPERLLEIRFEGIVDASLCCRRVFKSLSVVSPPYYYILTLDLLIETAAVAICLIVLLRAGFDSLL